MSISLASLAKNSPKAPRVIIYGEAGCGKTTFGACAPSPVFIQTEDGLGNLDATAFPLATSFDDVMAALQSLYTEDHAFQTLVVDSLDWLEPLVWAKVCTDSMKVDPMKSPMLYLVIGEGQLRGDFINKDLTQEQVLTAALGQTAELAA